MSRLVTLVLLTAVFLLLHGIITMQRSLHSQQQQQQQAVNTNQQIPDVPYETPSEAYSHLWDYTAPLNY